jgi:hypothetical protein
LEKLGAQLLKQVPQRDGAQLEGSTPLNKYTTFKRVKLENECAKFESKVLEMKMLMN